MKKGIHIVFFLGLLLYTSYRLFDSFKDVNDVTRRYEIFYTIPENSLNVLFVGSSHAFTAFMPSLINDSLGINSYVIGSYGQPAALSYFTIKEALRYQNPKIIVLETFTLSSQSKKVGYKIISHAFTSMEGFNKYRYIDSLFNEADKRNAYFPFNASHTKWKTPNFPLIVSNFSNEWLHGKSKISVNTNNYGFIGKAYKDKFLTDQTISEINSKSSFQARGLNSESDLYIGKIAKLCKENGIELMLMSIPVHKSIVDGMNRDDNKYNNWNSSISSSATKYNIPFTDYNFSGDSALYNKDYYENSKTLSQHLSVLGARYWSNVIATTLRKNYSELLPTQDEVRTILKEKINHELAERERKIKIAENEKINAGLVETERMEFERRYNRKLFLLKFPIKSAKMDLDRIFIQMDTIFMNKGEIIRRGKLYIKFSPNDNEFKKQRVQLSANIKINSISQNWDSYSLPISYNQDSTQLTTTKTVTIPGEDFDISLQLFYRDSNNNYKGFHPRFNKHYTQKKSPNLRDYIQIFFEDIGDYFEHRREMKRVEVEKREREREFMKNEQELLRKLEFNRINNRKYIVSNSKISSSYLSLDSAIILLDTIYIEEFQFKRKGTFKIFITPGEEGAIKGKIQLSSSVKAGSKTIVWDNYSPQIAYNSDSSQIVIQSKIKIPNEDFDIRLQLFYRGNENRYMGLHPRRNVHIQHKLSKEEQDLIEKEKKRKADELKRKIEFDRKNNRKHIVLNKNIESSNLRLDSVFVSLDTIYVSSGAVLRKGKLKIYFTPKNMAVLDSRRIQLSCNISTERSVLTWDVYSIPIRYITNSTVAYFYRNVDIPEGDFKISLQLFYRGEGNEYVGLHPRINKSIEVRKRENH